MKELHARKGRQRLPLNITRTQRRPPAREHKLSVDISPSKFGRKPDLVIICPATHKQLSSVHQSLFKPPSDKRETEKKKVRCRTQ